MAPQSFAYYCSGHGYGHATRVSALSAHLLQLTPKPSVTIVSSAPPHVFSDSMRLGAQYRNAKVDPVVQQPLAYRVDRKKSVQVLEDFLSHREWLIKTEVKWLKDNGITCVLSDAVFIACAAANRAHLPSVLITNFTFDSIWSYLSAPLIEAPTTLGQPVPGLVAPNAPPAIELEPDEPIPHEVMQPLAERIVQDYRNADLLFRLPGFLPFPSFSPANPIPATDWIDVTTQRFKPEVLAGLHKPVEEIPLYPSVPFDGAEKPVKVREMRAAPLLVRHPAPDVYTQPARQRILDSVGVPRDLQDPATTKVVIVSFGGQVIRKPSHSRAGSRNLSMTASPAVRPADSRMSASPPSQGLLGPPALTVGASAAVEVDVTPLTSANGNGKKGPSPPRVAELSGGPPTPPEVRMEKLRTKFESLPRIATPSHIYVPGAPPASNPASPLITRPPTFQNFNDLNMEDLEEEPEPRLLPDGWIAIVCGVSKNWGEEDLPAGFYIAPRDVWMPDLTAIGDVLLGKLGYGTCAECVDACTPFVYVPRPLIVEEHGLRELMESSGVGVLMTQAEYEMGDWATRIEEAYEKGKFTKAMKRKEGWSDIRKRQADGLARELVGWVDQWYDALETQEPPSYELAPIDSAKGGLTMDAMDGVVASKGLLGVPPTGGITLARVAAAICLTLNIFFFFLL